MLLDKQEKGADEYDIGEKFGFVKTTVEYTFQNSELKKELLLYLEDIIKNSIANN